MGFILNGELGSNRSREPCRIDTNHDLAAVIFKTRHALFYSFRSSFFTLQHIVPLGYSYHEGHYIDRNRKLRR